jgi:hypothetical protein
MVRDFVGQEIKSGMTVVYPVRRRSQMLLHALRVTMIEQGSEPKIIGYNGKGRRITIKNLHTVIVVPKTISVNPGVG